jgi:hypothetical protein
MRSILREDSAKHYTLQRADVRARRYKKEPRAPSAFGQIDTRRVKGSRENSQEPF